MTMTTTMMAMVVIIKILFKSYTGDQKHTDRASEVTLLCDVTIVSDIILTDVSIFHFYYFH